MGPTAKILVSSPALLAGREKGTAATSGASGMNGKIGLRLRRLVRDKEVTSPLSPTKKSTTT